jgi:hypothetical protein
MARMMWLMAENWPLDRALAARMDIWPGEIGPKGASLPLRLAGGLHALKILGLAPDLTAAYPPNAVGDAQLVSALRGAMLTHADFLDRWIDHAPQTNELGRSAVLIAGARWLAARHDIPFELSELGASAGLNLQFDRYALHVNGRDYGPDDAVLRLTPEWQGPDPAAAAPRIADRRGVDLNPLDPADDQDALRLLAYLWPDQEARLSRTRAALALPPAPVDRGDATDWLEQRLARRMPGRLHLILHTVAWQYFPSDGQVRGRALIEAAGAQATDDAPLAWLGMEADDNSTGAALSLRLWPGDLRIDLGRACFHGRWVRWAPKAA